MSFVQEDFRNILQEIPLRDTSESLYHILMYVRSILSDSKSADKPAAPGFPRTTLEYV